MRIILTGSTGLIGGRVWERIRVSHDVARLGRRDTCELRADLAVPTSIAGLDLSGYDALVHCAGVVDEDFINSPERVWAQAVAGTETLAAQALAGGVERVIYFSTTHVYGAFQGTLTEDSHPDPMSPYALAHYATEQVLKRFAHKGLKVFIIRPNAVYGTPVDWDTFDRWSLVPFDLPLQAVYCGKIILKTSGVQKRNFVAADDLAHYVEQLLEFSGKENPLFLNALGSDTLQIYDFAQMCAKVYQDKKGVACPIERPELPTVAEVFELLTNKPEFQPSEKILDFVKEFMSSAIERLAKGKTYGEHQA